MAEPPRLPAILLRWDQSTIYFVTICVEGRGKVLANPRVFEAIGRTALQLIRWRVLLGVVMPDHVHFVVAPVQEREVSVGDFATGFKHILRKELGRQDWAWQRGCFDRLLRSDESLQSKWIYIEDNPVRAGLVKHWQHWPYRLDFVNGDKEGKLAASPTARPRSDGKLAASPTGPEPR